MAPLPGSPNKTLLKVEKYLDSSTLVKLIEALPIFGEILVKLAQASPSFVETLAPLIFKNVDLTNKGYKAHLEKTDTFMGCIEELPILPTYIETFSARDKSCFGDASGDEGGKVDPFPDWIPWVLRTESLSRLTKLELNGAGIRIEDVVNLMFVGQVKELTVAYDYLTTHYIQDGWESFSCRSAGTSPLLALDLGHMSLVGDMLQHILIWPKALQKLRCNLARGTSEGIIVVDENSNEQGTSFKTMNFGSSVDPFMEEVRTSKGIMEFRQIYHRLPEWHTRDPLPPGTLVKALELIKDSLVELVVVDHWDDKTRLVERMCLSEFSSLQALNVPLDCLYYLDGLVPSFRPPQTLLPRSLKHLKVVYPIERFSVDILNRPWLFAVLKAKPKYLPNLEKIVLSIHVEHLYEADALKVDVADYLRPTFDGKGIETVMEVLVRKRLCFWQRVADGEIGPKKPSPFLTP